MFSNSEKCVFILFLFCFNFACNRIDKKKRDEKQGQRNEKTQIAITFDIMPTWLIEYYKRFDKFEMNKMNGIHIWNAEIAISSIHYQ